MSEHVKKLHIVDNYSKETIDLPIITADFDDNGYEYVDFGFQNKVIWALDENKINASVGGPKDGSWELATLEEFRELWNNSTISSVQRNSYSVFKFTNKNDTSKAIYLGNAIGHFNFIVFDRTTSSNVIVKISQVDSEYIYDINYNVTSSTSNTELYVIHPIIKSDTIVLEKGKGEYSVQQISTNARANGEGSFAEGIETTANGIGSHAEGFKTVAGGVENTEEGEVITGNNSHAEGESTQTIGKGSHAEGGNTIAEGMYSHAEGSTTTSTGYNSHAEGFMTISEGVSSHAEGENTLAEGSGAHAEGVSTKAIGEYSHAEGFMSVAGAKITNIDGDEEIVGHYSHAEGNTTVAEGLGSHAEGSNTSAIGKYSHAEGINSNAFGNYSHTEGNNTITTNDAEHASGKYNISMLNKTLFSIGNGSNEDNRHNVLHISNTGELEITNTLSDFNTESNVDMIYVQERLRKVIKIDCRTLRTLRDSSKLIPGMWYRITDYSNLTGNDGTLVSLGGSVEASFISDTNGFDILVLATSTNTLSEEARAVLHSPTSRYKDCNVDSWKIWYCLDNDTTRFEWPTTACNGVIYRMIDNNNNDIPYDFKHILFKRYRCTVDTTNYPMISELNNTYCGILGSSITGISISSSSSAYRYTFDTNTNTSSTSIGSDSSISKSNYNNVIKPYITSNKQILNNIVFLGSNIFDNYFNYDCYNMTFGSYCGRNTLNNNCYGYVFGYSCVGNIFGNYCYNNILNNNNQYNIFGNNCFYNILGIYCYYNSFGNNCYKIEFGRSCQFNSFGNGCSEIHFLMTNLESDNITLTASSKHNSFGNNCYNIYLNSYCAHNKFGNNCNFIALGTHNESNSFGNNCRSIVFGTLKNFNYTNVNYSDNASARTGNQIFVTDNVSTLYSYIKNIEIQNGVSFISLQSSTGASSSNNNICNVTIHKGVSGGKYTDSDNINIDNTYPILQIKIDPINYVSTTYTYETNVSRDKSGNITIWTT